MKVLSIIGAIVIAGLAYYFFTMPEEASDDTAEVVQIDEQLSTETPTPDELAEVDSQAVSFDVAGVNHLFDVKEIRVKEGDEVTINFVSDDGYHDWVVDEFAAATEKVRPGTPTSVTFTASKAGTYEYYCSVGDHRAKGMVGKLIVE